MDEREATVAIIPLDAISAGLNKESDEQSNKLVEVLNTGWVDR